MLQRRHGLSDSDLDAIRSLERRTLAADGGRLKLEWGALRARKTDRVTDILWWDGDELVGFCGLYEFGGQEAEVAGMVDPAHRRRGIGSALLTDALVVLSGRGAGGALLVCPRSAAAEGFAARHSAPLEHSEYALVQRDPPPAGDEDPATSLRAATVDDAADVARLLEAGFGHPAGDVAANIASDDGEDHVLVVREGRAVGYLRLTFDGHVGGVYGFVIDPSLQGRGIGRDVLRRCCRTLRERGATRIGLEVAVDNPRALGLYTSLGFEPTSTEDYYRLTV